MITGKCIINADDFGMSAAVNEAISLSFDRGLISSASMLSTGPCFEAAVEMVDNMRLHGRIGVHLNLVEGTPLTTGILTCRRLAREGRFDHQIATSKLTVSKEEHVAIYDEWDAQIRRCIQFGIRPTHIDSHHHVHTTFPLLNIALSVARQHQIRHVRLSRNIGWQPSIPKRLYKTLINHRIRSLGLSSTRFFGSIDDALLQRNDLPDVTEIMVHPSLHENVLVDYLAPEPRKSRPLADVIQALNLQRPPISFGML
jgi:predicted glycoside hydrolase/deacetylase ChbG (UPF0249 family)